MSVSQSINQPSPLVNPSSHPRGEKRKEEKVYIPRFKEQAENTQDDDSKGGGYDAGRGLALVEKEVGERGRKGRLP